MKLKEVRPGTSIEIEGFDPEANPPISRSGESLLESYQEHEYSRYGFTQHPQYTSQGPVFSVTSSNAPKLLLRVM